MRKSWMDYNAETIVQDVEMGSCFVFGRARVQIPAVLFEAVP
jgi:hypothetical protein